jgi:hypothetical protein
MKDTTRPIGAIQEQQRREIEEIATGLSPQARKNLIPLLGELFNTLDNLGAICPTDYLACRQYMRFDKLRRLLAALNEESSPDGTDPPGLGAPLPDADTRGT